MLLVYDIDDGEVVVDAAILVGHAQDFAVDPRLVVAPPDRRRPCSDAGGAKPLVRGNRSGGRPRAAAVESYFLAHGDEVVRPGDGEKLRLVLKEVAFPEKP